MDINFLPAYLNVCFGFAFFAVLLWGIVDYIITKKITWGCFNLVVLWLRYAIAILLYIVVVCFFHRYGWVMLYGISVLLSIFIMVMIVSASKVCSVVCVISCFIEVSFGVKWLVIIFSTLVNSLSVMTAFVMSVIIIFGFFICPGGNQYERSLKRYKRDRLKRRQNARNLED